MISPSKSNKQISNEIKAKIKPETEVALNRIYGTKKLDIENFKQIPKESYYLDESIEDNPFYSYLNVQDESVQHVKSGQTYYFDLDRKLPKASIADSLKSHSIKPLSVFWNHGRVYNNHKDGSNLLFRVEARRSQNLHPL